MLPHRTGERMTLSNPIEVVVIRPPAARHRQPEVSDQQSEVSNGSEVVSPRLICDLRPLISSSTSAFSPDFSAQPCPEFSQGEERDVDDLMGLLLCGKRRGVLRILASRSAR